MILGQLQQAVGGATSTNDEAAREFLGYAPVLDTVADSRSCTRQRDPFGP
jgi:hypothetical protein